MSEMIAEEEIKMVTKTKSRVAKSGVAAKSNITSSKPVSHTKPTVKSSSISTSNSMATNFTNRYSTSHSSSLPGGAPDYSLPPHANEAVPLAPRHTGRKIFFVAMIIIFALTVIFGFLFFVENNKTFAGQAYAGAQNTIGFVLAENPADLPAQFFDLKANVGAAQTVAFHFKVALPSGVTCSVNPQEQLVLTNGVDSITQAIASSIFGAAGDVDYQDSYCEDVNTVVFEQATADYARAVTGEVILATIIIPSPAAGNYQLVPSDVHVINLETSGDINLVVESYDLAVEAPAGEPVPGPNADTDGDSILDAVDNCPANSNGNQADTDRDGIGNVCDICTGEDDTLDVDSDTFCASNDNCDDIANARQKDQNRNGVGDACEPNPAALEDKDEDGRVNIDDNCRDVANSDQADVDLDGIGDVCDVEVNAPEDTDFDHDGVSNADDNCERIANPLQEDSNGFEDGDGAGDACEMVPPLEGDVDRDTVPDETDNCPHVSNVNQADIDNDNAGDACDPADDSADADADGVPDHRDSCIDVVNPDQSNLDHDGYGDMCDPDMDNDGVANADDECPLDAVNTCNGDPSAVNNEASVDDGECAADALQYCSSIQECERVGLFWYDTSCHTQLAPLEDECNPFNLDPCTTQELCEAANLYWYDEQCNAVDQEVILNQVTCEDGNVEACLNPETCQLAGYFWYESINRCVLEEPEIIPGGVPEEIIPPEGAENLDLNNDQCVGLKDISIVAANFDLSCSVPKAMGEGDVTNDSCVTFADFRKLMSVLDWECDEE